MFVGGESLKDLLADWLLCQRVRKGSEKSERAPFTIDAGTGGPGR